MAHTRRTLNLDQESWDLTLNGVGLIELTDGEYATAQNVSNEARLFVADAYFIQDKGIPHFIAELGRRVSNMAVLHSYLRKAALRVVDVNDITSINVVDFDPITRTLSGSITFNTREGERNVAITTYF